MPVLSYVHQLFNTEQCQAYIHTLRWKERPLQCPRCQSHDVGPWGTYHYQPGVSATAVKACKRTFNDLTDTLLHRASAPRTLASRHLSVMPLVFVATHCPGGGGPYPDQLPLVLVAAQYRAVLRNRSPVGGDGRSG